MPSGGRKLASSCSYLCRSSPLYGLSPSSMMWSWTQPSKHLQVIKMKEEKDRTAARTEKRTERAEGRLTAPKQL